MVGTVAPPAELVEPYRQEVSDVAAALGTDSRRGLTDAEARARLDRWGHNELQAEQRVPAWRRFLAQFRNTLVLLLLVATAISAGLWVYERDSPLPYEALAILAVVLLNAAMGYLQESRAEAAVAALRAMSADDATVIRDGERRRVPAAELVPGDLVLVEEGDIIPGDARIVTATALQAAEAALTGESLPVAKDAAPIADLVVVLTDARYYVPLSRNVYRFMPVRLTPTDLQRMHGTNERVAIVDYERAIRIYRQLSVNAAGN